MGPVLVYMGLGMLWLWERGWMVLAHRDDALGLAGIVFSILAARWTKSRHPMMPPLDWDSPQTFSPLDRDAWKIVQDAADEGEACRYEALLEIDTYINAGKRSVPAAGRPLSSPGDQPASTTSRWSSS